MNGYVFAMRRAARKYRVADGKEMTVKRRLPLAPFVLGAVICALLLPLVVMLGIRSDQRLAEWWTRNIQAGWEKAIGTLTSWLPFSVMELFIVFGIIVGIYLLVRLVKNLCAARFIKALDGVLAVGIGLVYILNIYTLSMGFGYYRAAMPVPQADGYTLEQTVAVTQYFLDDYNYLSEKLDRDENGCVECPYTFGELAEIMKGEFARLDDGYFSAYTPTAKPIVNSWFLSDMLITGITFLPFGEAGVNTVAPPSEIPLTMAHELAHTKGVQREGDANLLARYVLLSSDNEYLRYCGYYGAFGNLLSAILLFDDREQYDRLVDRMPEAVYDERWYANKYWLSQPDFIGDISEFFNNIYLKLNGALNGTGSYNDGNVSDVEIKEDPDTGETVREIYFSQTQKMFFAIYEAAVSNL